MSVLTVLAKRLLALTPYRVTRNAPNRFEGVVHCLGHLRKLGYETRLIIDGGAHLGTFSQAAAAIFPDAQVHMIEPQPACRAPLEALAADRGFAFHPCALGAEAGTAGMVCEQGPNTGAHLVWPAQLSQATAEVQVETLDNLLSSQAKAGDRALLKLDLQGHELMALAGATITLPFVDVAIVEVSFFRQIGEPTIPEMINFFDENGFDLFDVAGLSGRARDGRLRQGDFVFVRRGSAFSADTAWA